MGRKRGSLEEDFNFKRGGGGGKIKKSARRKKNAAFGGRRNKGEIPGIWNLPWVPGGRLKTEGFWGVLSRKRPKKKTSEGGY